MENQQPGHQESEAFHHAGTESPSHDIAAQNRTTNFTSTSNGSNHQNPLLSDILSLPPPTLGAPDSQTPINECSSVFLYIFVRFFADAILDLTKFYELNEIEKRVGLMILDETLQPEPLLFIKSILSLQPHDLRNPILLKRNDFSIKKSRFDQTLKLVTSQALKKLYHNFMKSHGINKSFNPKKYTKRAEINRLIYLYYFKTEPVRDEHMKLFLIKNGVTREWFQGAVGGEKKNPAFIEDLLKILNDEKFYHFYKSKIDSMIRRILGVVEYAEEEELLNNESEKANKIKNKLQGGSDPAKAKKPKMPCHKYLFKQCISNTRQKIQELAAEKQIKLSDKSS